MYPWYCRPCSLTSLISSSLIEAVELPPSCQGHVISTCQGDTCSRQRAAHTLNGGVAIVEVGPSVDVPLGVSRRLVWRGVDFRYKLTESGSSGAAWLMSSSRLADGSVSLDSAVAMLHLTAVSINGGVFRLLPAAALLTMKLGQRVTAAANRTPPWRARIVLVTWARITDRQPRRRVSTTN
jgi:hypothetical protein